MVGGGLRGEDGGEQRGQYVRVVENDILKLHAQAAQGVVCLLIELGDLRDDGLPEIAAHDAGA